MLSILIPVHNFDLRKLVHDLHSQALLSRYEFEIIVVDDFSLEEKKNINREISHLDFVKYIELESNIGRSAIRNKLADLAKYSHLIFIDSDAEVNSIDFIENYAKNTAPNSVVCGGMAYSSKHLNETNSLRHFYGISREMRTANERNKQANASFISFNFMISKDLFSKVKFNESITTYGHEDTLFGYDLQKQGITIQHIDNYLLHAVLDTNTEFLLKTKQSIKTLFQLINDPKIDTEFCFDISLIRVFNKVKKAKMIWIFALVYKNFQNTIEKRLSSKPNLVLFDIYKLSYLCGLSRK